METAPISVRTTDPNLLDRVRDWQDGEAWDRFVRHYDPQLRALCRRFGLKGERADDACQQTWIKLATRMRRFHYDPGLRFRGWLQTFFQRSLLDVLKAGGAPAAPDGPATDAVAETPEPFADDPDPLDAEFLALLRRAEEVQEAVRSRVKPENWAAFLLIAIEGRPVSEAADLLDRPYMAVYRAYQRVKAMVAEERLRRESAPESPR